MRQIHTNNTIHCSLSTHWRKLVDCHYDVVKNGYRVNNLFTYQISFVVRFLWCYYRWEYVQIFQVYFQVTKMSKNKRVHCLQLMLPNFSNILLELPAANHSLILRLCILNISKLFQIHSILFRNKNIEVSIPFL